MTDISEIVIDSKEIINYLKSEMSLREVCQKILYQRIINNVAQEKSIIVTTEEIEIEADRQRREQRLEKAVDTLTWLAEQLVSPYDWEIGIRNQLLAQKLAQTLFAKEAEKFFHQNRQEFEQIVLYQIIVTCEKLAQELYYQIEEGEISFYEAAHIYDIDEHRRQKCGYEGKMYRWAIQPNIAEVVFGSPPQHLIGPLRSEQGYHLLLVEEVIAAELTPQRYQEIINNMFQQWLTSEVQYLLNSGGLYVDPF
ncbi:MULTISPECIES: peptidylprolyl isomerase [Fischerella]|uniref:peptidylprolyl isomerase n=1 Tax=Fischerella muscicola CCMEE 5323 TaxID=2019572 RepID=A0A2N6JUG7_FISMU|nr:MULTISPECIES: peptidylprolyl isomerase [Fischerella]MBD2434802.1 peptidylprolyl isomerase [Fischerella sp. FACHB-380]PLZ81291.1 peptidylprolyl isomerase [Fischerella muscicola CCMEE 5323]